MFMNRKTISTCCVAALMLTEPSPARAAVLGTAFTYQGRLTQGGIPANGLHDLRFRLFDAATGGAQIASTFCVDNASVNNGLFTVAIDFGAQFAGDQRFLDIEVRADTGLDCNIATGFTSLGPRQPLTASPHALFALTSSASVNAAQLNGQSAAFYQNASNLSSGTVADARLSSNVALMNNSQTFTGVKTFASAPSFTAGGAPFTVANSTKVTNLNADLLDGLNSSAFLQSVPLPLNVVGTATGAPIVRGENASSAVGAVGVYGFATATTGAGRGVFGQSAASSGFGVYGTATSTTGIGQGGHFESAGEFGVGVIGKTTSATGDNTGGLFTSDSTGGTGLSGWATASSGSTRGIYGQCNSTAGTAIAGVALATTGTTFAVSGQSHSSTGRGVFGFATATTGINYGVYGDSNSSQGFAGYFEGRGPDAVYVLNAGSGRGLQAFSAADTAIWGRSNTGIAGVDGWNASTTGRGVSGYASASSGVTYGVYGQSNSTSGFDFYAAGAGADYGSTSSRRWKHNIELIETPLEKLDALRGVYFHWDQEHGGRHDLGMIAEEVGAVLPEIVQYEANGIDAIGMDYGKMTPLLVEAVKAVRAEKDQQIAEQTLRIEQQQAQIDALQRQYKEMQQRLAALELVLSRFGS